MAYRLRIELRYPFHPSWRLFLNLSSHVLYRTELRLFFANILYPSQICSQVQSNSTLRIPSVNSTGISTWQYSRLFIMKITQVAYPLLLIHTSIVDFA